MKGETIGRMWRSYMEGKGLSGMPESASGKGMAVVFGAVECKIDYQGGRIRVPSLGWVKMHDLGQETKDPDWVSLVNRMDGSQPSLVMGHGNPFRDEMASVFPSHEGLLIAVPFAEPAAPQS